MVMNKADAIKRINSRLGKPTLTEQNTIFSTLATYGTDLGWWLKLPFASFRKELHIVLNNDSTQTFQHLKINASQILSPATKFRCSDGAADAFMTASAPKRLIDLLQGGCKYNFTKHVVNEYKH